MKRSKWMAATVLLAMGLSAGAFAQDRAWNGRDAGQAAYSQHDTRERAQAWNKSYREDGDRYRRDDDDRGRYRDQDDRDHHANDRDHRDRDHGRRDGDDRGR